VVGRSGVTAELFPDLDRAEHDALRRSAELLKSTADALTL
jgi:L-lactate dehydrogenase